MDSSYCHQHAYIPRDTETAKVTHLHCICTEITSDNHRNIHTTIIPIARYQQIF